MKLAQFLIVGTLFPLAIAGCRSTGGMTQEVYPAHIVVIGESSNYPLKAAGFQRVRIMTHAPGMTNISTAYNYSGTDAQIAATIYVFTKGEKQTSISEKFEAEKADIQMYHPGAKLLGTGKETFLKNGIELAALTAKYELKGNFFHRHKRVYSEFMLIEHQDKFIKLRSTSPKHQRRIASKKNLELMNAVNWANQP